MSHAVTKFLNDKAATKLLHLPFLWIVSIRMGIFCPFVWLINNLESAKMIVFIIGIIRITFDKLDVAKIQL